MWNENVLTDKLLTLCQFTNIKLNQLVVWRVMGLFQTIANSFTTFFFLLEILNNIFCISLEVVGETSLRVICKKKKKIQYMFILIYILHQSIILIVLSKYLHLYLVKKLTMLSSAFTNGQIWSTGGGNYGWSPSSGMWKHRMMYSHLPLPPEFTLELIKHVLRLC